MIMDSDKTGLKAVRNIESLSEKEGQDLEDEEMFWISKNFASIKKILNNIFKLLLIMFGSGVVYLSLKA